MVHRRVALLVGLLGSAALLAPGAAHAATVTLVPSLPSGQLVATTVTWTAATSSPDPTDFRLSVKALGGPLRVMYDFSPNNVFAWTPLDDDNFILIVSARNRVTGEISYGGAGFSVLPRATTAAVVTPTSHPLVALYSAPPCAAGDVFVLFRPQAGGQFSATTPKPCRGRSVNFLVAGMPADTPHWLRHIRVVNGTIVEQGPLLSHRTGVSVALFPPVTVLQPADPDASSEGVLLHGPVNTVAGVFTRFPFATNLGGEVIWYDRRAGLGDLNLYRPVTGGTLLLAEDSNDVADQVLREVDLAGNIVRETTAARISEQLAAMGQDRFTAFHHEARRLPNGYTILLGAVERILTDVQGPGPVNVLGDYILVLDVNWQVAWVWNSFDHLDATRKAILNETCVSEGPGCPPLFLGPTANDWLHSNAVAYSAGDGNLILSMRHQDWVIKIDYRNGLGDGHVIWRLGQNGDFTLAPSDPLPWFSHQHDPNWGSGGRLAVYDNGNTRCVTFASCFSRGQVYQLDETALTATLVVNADLGNYSAALGSAQALSNGNFHFNSGFQNPPTFEGWSDEVRPDGTKALTIGVASAVYRSFRLKSLYIAPEDLPMPAPASLEK